MPMQGSALNQPCKKIFPPAIYPRSQARIRCIVTRASIERRTLGRTSLHVSSLCLGCMLFGEGTPENVARRLLDVALEHGINFFDVAEMYPVPQRAETQGKSEEILGRWIKRRKCRQDVVIATKVAGPGGMMWLRDGPIALDASNISQAIDGSLNRLQVDCIDLLQLHWPDRYVPMFGHSEYYPSNAYSSVPIEEQLKAVDRAVAAGKVLHFGLSNETPWGLMRFCTTAEYLGNKHSLPHSDSTVVDRDTPQRAHQRHACATPVSLQNAYSLTCRTFDSGGLAECCHQEGIGLLAYSPLAMGLLTGKYLRADGGPSEARLNKYRGRYAEAESRYGPKSNVREAVQAYVELATRWGIAPVELAIRFVLSHPLVTAAVTGATSEEQLKELIAAAGRPPLQAEIRAEVDAIHRRYPNPTP